MERIKKDKKLYIDGVHTIEYISDLHSNVAIDREVLQDELGILLVTDGAATICTDRDEYPMMPKDVFIHYEFNPYWFQIKPNCQSSFYYLCFHLQEGKEMLGLTRSNSACLCERLRRLRPQLCHGNLELFRAISSSFHLFQSSDQTDYQYAQAKMVVFLHRILEIAGSIEAPQEDEIITAVIKYIHHHITEDISLADLAQEAGLSLSYFKIKFKKEMRITPNNYINMCKIARAKRMLAHGYSITQTAMALSFNTSSYFSTVFHRYSSYTPKQYQKLVFSEKSHMDF